MHMRKSTLFALLASAPASLVFASPVSATTYHLWGCHTPAGQAAPTDGWAPQAPDSAPGIQSGCTVGGGLSASAGQGSGIGTAAMAFTMPSSLTLQDATIWRFAQARDGSASSAEGAANIWKTVTWGDNGSTWKQVGLQSDGDQFSVYSGIPQLGTPLDLSAEANRHAFPLTAESQASSTPIGVSVTCGSTDDGCDARYVITRYDFVLDDAAAPVVRGVGGTLLNAAGKLDPSSPVLVSGKQNLVVVGSDGGSGVYRTVVKADGVEVATGKTAATPGAANRCAPEAAPDGRRAFVMRQPCPAETSLVTNWDTSGIADGRHTVEVLLEDAAGNQTPVTSGLVSVRNSTSTGPGSPVEFRGEPNGSAADDASSIIVGFPKTARKPSNKKSVVKRCKRSSWASKHAVQCSGRSAQTTAITTWSETKAEQLSGTLADSRGVPVSNAKLEVHAATLGGGDRAVGVVTSDTQGKFRVGLLRAEGSQSVTVRWMARQNDTVPTATATALLRVKASVSFKQPRTLRAGHKATFRGSIPATNLPAGGRTVSLQWKKGRGWATFAEPITDSTGHWIWKQRFSERASYQMRVLVRALPTYPFEENTSKVRSFSVR